MPPAGLLRCHPRSAPRSRACSSLVSVAPLVLLALAACRPAGLGAPDSRIAARARLIRIDDTRADEAAWLDSTIASSDPVLRRYAVITAGRLGGRAHLSALRRSTADADAGVASAAFFALGLLKDSASAGSAAAAIRGPTPVAREAAWLLGEIGTGARSALLDAARDSSVETAVRAAALLALARIRPVPVESLLPLLSSPDTAIVWRTAYTLARARSPAAVRALIRTSTSESVDVRDHSARGLGRALAGDSLGREAQDALVRLAHDQSARVRVTAVRVLAGYGAASAAAIASALGDSDPSVRITAASFAFQALDSSSARWDALWDADTTFAFRRALAEAALRRGRLAARWSGWRSDPRWQHRAAAAELDAHGEPAGALARVVTFLQDADGRVRAAAAGAVATLSDSVATRGAARTRLVPLLRDADFEVRATALGALAKGATVEDLALALDSHTIGAADADNDARLAFWRLADSALARAGGRVPDSLGRRLDALPRPADPLERAAASAIARFAAWREGGGTARDPGWYEARAREALSPRPPVAVIETDRGRLELGLFPADAPVTVYNFVSLARRGYFDGQRFHRVVPNFVVQGGDPRGDGNGGPGYAIRDELNPHRYERGTLGMALSGPHTGGSQFFVTHAPQPHLDGGYSVFGQLRAGEAVLDRIVQGDRIVRITIR